MAELKAGHAGQLAAAQQQVSQLSERLSQQLQAPAGSHGSSASCKDSGIPGQQQQQQPRAQEQQVRHFNAHCLQQVMNSVLWRCACMVSMQGLCAHTCAEAALLSVGLCVYVE